MEITGNTLSGIISGSTAMRQKYWKELSIEEKIERMRTETKRLQQENEDLRGKIYKLEIISQQHTHDTFGRILVPANNVKESDYKRTKLMDKGGDEVYF